MYIPVILRDVESSEVIEDTMKTIRYEVTVGIFFVSAMLILGYYTIIMSKKAFEPKNSYKMTAIFPTVVGLEKTDKVKVNGVAAGYVERIQLKGYRVLVTLKMFQEFTMYENYEIRIKTQAALGGSHINIYSGAPTDKTGKKVNKIVLARNNLPGFVDDPISSITKLIEENRTNIFMAIKNIRSITDKLNRGKGTLGQLLNKDKVHSDAGDLVKDIRDAIEDTREQAPVTSFIRAALTAF